MNKYIIVSTEVMAKAILCLTNIKFDKFINKDGNTRYSFPREKEVMDAYSYIQDYKNKK